MIWETIIAGATEKILEKIVKESAIPSLKFRLESWASLVVQFKEDDLLKLSDAGNKIKNIIDEYNPEYDRKLRGVSLINYNSNKFYIGYNFYWKEEGVGLENNILEYLSYIKDKKIEYEEDNPFVESMTLYIIPKKPLSRFAPKVVFALKVHFLLLKSL